MNNFRKSLVAIATASVVSLAGVGVATAQDGGDAADQQPVVTDDNNDGGSTSPSELSGEAGSAEGSSDMDAKELREWISVFTAVIGALTALYTFINRYVMN